MGGKENTPSGNDPRTDVIDLLLRREQFLDRLSDSSVEKPDLIKDLNVSRSTVDRAINALRSEGLVERRSDGFGLTHYGEISLHNFRQFSRDLETIRHSRSHLRLLPPSTDIHPAFFRNGSVISDGEDGNRKPTAILRDLLAEAETFWAVTESPHFELISLAHKRVVEEGMQFRLIHSIDSIERLRIHYPDILESTLRSGNLALYSVEEAPPFGLIKASGDTDTVALVLYESKREPETVVLTESCVATERFDAFFRDQRQRAREIYLDDDGSPVLP